MKPVKVLSVGYYGFDNAGDEAVLAAIKAQLEEQIGSVEMTVTSGNVLQTEAMHGPNLSAIGRNDFRAWRVAARASDLVICGGGSLFQDVTSLRSVVYYFVMMRLAQLARKPTMFYAQGIGPLKRKLSQKLVRAAANHARAITVRDDASKVLLEEIGVRKKVEVTADPVWALRPSAERNVDRKRWRVCLRDWADSSREQGSLQEFVSMLREEASAAAVDLDFLPMQPGRDDELLRDWGVAEDEIVQTAGKHPSEIMTAAGDCSLMIAMRLHALIFAVAQSVPCVAINYDPKVGAVAEKIGAPVLDNVGDESQVKNALSSATAPDAEVLNSLKNLSRRNAEIAAGLL